MSTETNTTHELREGQVWEYLPSANLGCERRTIVMINGGLHPTDESGEVRCNDMEWFVAHARLLADAPPAAPKVECKAPEGYVECSKKCGRWTSPVENPRQRCNACQPGSDFYMAEYPDWAPPLESKPAETGFTGINRCGFPLGEMKCTKADGHSGEHGITTPWIKLGGKPAPEAPKAETVAYLLKCGFRVTGDSKAQADSARVGHEANCIDCNPMLQPTQYREPHPPAPEAPKAIGPVCRHAKRGDGPCSGPVATRTIGCRGTALSMCEGHMLYRERIVVGQMEAQNGTPYTGPERLPKPKLAADWVWDCLEDVR